MPSSTTLTRRRTRRALGIAALLPVLALAACNGDDSGGADPAQDPAASTGGQNGGTGGQDTEGGTGGEGGDGKNSAIPPLSQAQLAQAALTTGDLPGWEYKDGKGIDDEDTMDAEPRTCQPIVDVLGSRPAQPRTAHVQLTGVKGETSNRTVVPMLISAYAPGDAEKFLGELRQAVPQCGSFQVSEKGAAPEEFHATVSPEQMTAGDESFTFDLGSPKALEGTIRVTVVRTGGNTTTLLGSDMASRKATLVDQAIAHKQHEKLVAAAGS